MADGDHRSTTVPATELPLGKGVGILLDHPAGALFLNKPNGILSHPNHAKDLNKSLLTVAYDKDQEAFLWSDDSGTPKKLYLCHRLDEATSGVITTAYNLCVARQIRKSFANKTANKVYRAFLIGRMRRKKDMWRDRLLKKVHSRGIKVVVDPRGQPSETAVELIRIHETPLGTLSEVHLFPATGRSHQLRVQSARRNLPILGDPLYGDFTKNRNFANEDKDFGRLFLHAENLKVNLTKPKLIILSVQSPLPEAYTKLASCHQSG